MKRKIVAIILAMSMVLSVPIGAYGEESGQVGSIKTETEGSVDSQNSDNQTEVDQKTPAVKDESSTSSTLAVSAVNTTTSTITLDKSTYAKGETIIVNYTGAQNTKDWLGVNQDANTAGDSILWSYLNESCTAPSTVVANGTTRINTTSLEPGTYYIHYSINDTYTDYASASFTITAAGTMSLNKTTCTKGDTIIATFTGAQNAKDWICVNQDANAAGHSILWSYLNNSTSAPSTVQADGTTTIDTSSLAVGTYYVYYCSNDLFGYYAKASFTVTPATTITLDKTTYARGETISINYTNAQNVKDWICINQDANNAGNSLIWCYMNGNYTAPTSVTTNSTVKISTTSLAPGTYYIYYCKNDGFDCYAKASFTVTAANPTMTLNKTTCVKGDTISVSFSGAQYLKDWICVNQKTTAGNSILWYYLNGTTTAPDTFVITNGTIAINTSTLSPGTYNVYFCKDGGYTSYAKASFTVTESVPGGSYTVTSVPGEYVDVAIIDSFDANVSKVYTLTYDSNVLSLDDAYLGTLTKEAVGFTGPLADGLSVNENIVGSIKITCKNTSTISKRQVVTIIRFYCKGQGTTTMQLGGVTQ